MRFRYEPLSRLPMLAWLAVLEDDRTDVTVFHGLAVEVHDDFFIEGAWSGDFVHGHFASTDCIFGSGATLTGGTLTFVSSAATTDYLYYRRLHHGLVVSNSLPFLLAYTHDQLDPRCATYDRINGSIALGVNRYTRELPTRDGAVVRLMWRNLEAYRGEMAERDKSMPPSFHTFADYSSYLERNYASIVRNVRDSARTVSLRIYSTQSKGYDTTAVNAIAHRYGIDAVFTISKGKAFGRFADADAAFQVDDDGTEICHALGLRSVIALDRRAFERAPALEYLFYAALDDNQDANFVGIREHLAGPAVLLSGTLGELWYPYWPYYERDCPHLRGPDLGRGDLGTHSLTEFRLTVGFVHLPLIFVGARAREDILRITGSEEMRPWNTDGEYNRPIARRLAEEAGVPRKSFGQKKMAAVVEFAMPRVPFGKCLLAEYRQFLVENRIIYSWSWPLVSVIRHVNATIMTWHSRGAKGVYYLERLIERLVRRTYRLPQLGRKLNGRIFCFCANKRTWDYAVALQDTSQRVACSDCGGDVSGHEH